MKTIYFNSDVHLTTPQVATIGFFDGVHRGHQFILKQVCQAAKEAGMESMVITFDRHPRQVLHEDYQPQLLTTLTEKVRLLELTGIDCCVILPFSTDMAALSAQMFMQSILKEHLNVRQLLIGYDNRFGHNRAEGFEDYVRYGRQMGIRVAHNTVFEPQGLHISSSAIRKYIEQGNISMANECLGRPYQITSTVVNGFHEGRKIGFPTANLDPQLISTMLPANGVYAVLASIGNEDTWHEGMMNIGFRPTFKGQTLSVEVNIFNFNEDIYGRQVTVRIIRHMRDEHKFSSPEQLSQQITDDRQHIRDFFEQQKHQF